MIAKALDVEPYRLLDPKEKDNLVRFEADPEMQEILAEMEDLCKQAGMDCKFKKRFSKRAFLPFLFFIMHFSV